MNTKSLRCLARLGIGIITTLACLTTLAVPVGPKLPEEAPKTESWPAYKRLSNAELDVAVVVLNPNFNENDARMRQKGIWPEVRKVEAIRSAYRIKEALERINQFQQVTVAPSTIVSADLYLRGRIDKSTAEIMEIRWNLLDARGAEWIDWKTSSHRVVIGWHQRFYEPGKDAFQPLWNEIATDVYNRLKSFAKDHARVARENASRTKRGKSPRLSTLEEITVTRDLVLARFFAPEHYGDSINVSSKDQWEITYLPDTTTEDWLRIQAFAKSDSDVAALYDKHYETFFKKVNPNYEAWVNEVFPYARQMRREQRRYKTERVIGGLVLAAAGVAAVDADTASARDTALAVGAAVGGGLILKSMFDRADFSRNLGYFDELSQNYHDTFQPTNLEVQGETITLQGKADAQFTRWRQVLKEVYVQDQADAYDIRIVEDTRDTSR